MKIFNFRQPFGMTNFIIAEKGGKSSDVKQLIETIRQRVKENFDIELELEIEIW